MKYLYLPIPVTQFFQRIVEFVYYLTASNHYLLLRKAQVEADVGLRGLRLNDANSYNEKRSVGSSTLHYTIGDDNARHHVLDKLPSEKAAHAFDRCALPSTDVNSRSTFTFTFKQLF